MFINLNLYKHLSLSQFREANDYVGKDEILIIKMAKYSIFINKIFLAFIKNQKAE